MRIALVCNPGSGAGLDPANLVAAMDGRVSVFEPDQLPDVEGAAPERIVVAGGDGSIAPFARLAGRLGIPLGVIPGGTANDFARATGLPDDPRRAAALAATGTELRNYEIGLLADDTPFVNVASAGLASVAARRAAPLKSRLGPFAYGIGAVHAGATAAPLECVLRIDGDTVFEGEVWQLIIAVTGAFGGGSGVAAADPSDGDLDVTVVPAGSRLMLVRRAWGLRRHTIAEQRDVPHYRGAVVELDVPPGIEYNADGELRSGGLECVTAERDAYRLVVG